MENLKYPIGELALKDSYTLEETTEHIAYLKNFPSFLKETIKDITEEQLETAYRPGGWTAKQVIHHISDSHTQMLTRIKWTLTEETPTIKAYFEDRWANLSDYKLPFDVSVNLIEGIHIKVVALAESLDSQELKKSYLHPENGQYYSLEKVLALYTWHSKHHLAHIKICKGEW